jgi:hypothetical protein
MVLEVQTVELFQKRLHGHKKNSYLEHTFEKETRKVHQGTKILIRGRRNGG